MFIRGTRDGFSTEVQFREVVSRMAATEVQVGGQRGDAAYNAQLHRVLSEVAETQGAG